MTFSEKDEYGLNICPVCGKHFLLPVENLYHFIIKGRREDYCSYTCYRKIQKKLDRNKVNKRRV